MRPFLFLRGAPTPHCRKSSPRVSNSIPQRPIQIKPYHLAITQKCEKPTKVSGVARILYLRTQPFLRRNFISRRKKPYNVQNKMTKQTRQTNLAYSKSMFRQLWNLTSFPLQLDLIYPCNVVPAAHQNRRKINSNIKACWGYTTTKQLHSASTREDRNCSTSSNSTPFRTRDINKQVPDWVGRYHPSKVAAISAFRIPYRWWGRGIYSRRVGRPSFWAQCEYWPFMGHLCQIQKKTLLIPASRQAYAKRQVPSR